MDNYDANATDSKSSEDFYFAQPRKVMQLKKVRTTAVVPSYGSGEAAGLDLSACIDEPITIYSGDKSVLIPTGIAIWINNPNFFAIITPRSGLGHKKGLVLGNGVGVIDSDYQGELFVSVCVRPGHDDVTIQPGDRIAQYVVLPVARVDQFNFVDEFESNSARGSDGFGSTGVSS